MDQAYCGPAPTPESLAVAWNADLVAIALCAVLAGLHLATRKRGRGPLAISVVLLLLLFVSPLCALTVALFSARAAHHVVLIAGVAPLLALAFAPRCGEAPRFSPTLLAGAHAAILWFWHAPEVYAAAVVNPFLYWLMQGSLLGSAFLLWRGVFGLRDPGPALFALLATIVQMGMLGALLTFARQPLYAPHFLTTDAFGLLPLDDQQLAGIIMWVPAALPYVIAGLILLAMRFPVPARTAR